MIDDILPPKRKLRGGEPQPAKTEPPDTTGSVEQPLGVPVEDEVATPPAPKEAPKKTRFWHDRKRLLIIGGGLAALLIAFIAGYLLFIKKDAPKPIANYSKPLVKIEKPKPVIITSPLTGTVVTEAQSKRPVTAIMIENSPDARPQSGLRDAGVVYEAIAEGGITRFLTLFQESTPAYIGPVRSVRPYYLDWLAPFDASVAHVGGSLDALQQVRSGMKDLDQFFNAPTYSRISSRYAPHNVYTDFTRLDALNTQKGYTASKFTSWPRKAEQPATVPTAKTIDVNISGFYYNVHYDYDAASNSYLRSEGGKPHVDILAANDKAPVQLHPKVVLVLVMPYSYGPADDGARSTYGTNGSGQLFLYQDGIYTPGTWSKTDRASQFVFHDAADKELKLNAGQTWITIVSSAGSVIVKP